MFKLRIWRVQLFIFLVSAGMPLLAADPSDITVRMTGFRNEKGPALVYLWRATRAFPKDTDQALTMKSVPIQGNSAVAVFEGVEPGAYAVSVTHDENENGKMDTGFLGKPKEGYGTSNNPRTRMSAPSFDDCKFELGSAGHSIEIEIRY